MTAAVKVFRGVILGAPASGKGTISDRIVKKFKIQHLSSGDLLRNHVKNKTEIGLEAHKFIEKGLLVPDDVITQMIDGELGRMGNAEWLLDGFPRTRQQAEFLYEHHPVKTVLNLVVPFDVIISRVQGRWIHVPSGRVYNLDFNAPKTSGVDDVTGEKLEQRADDKPEAVRKRLEIYEETIGPVLEFYREKNIVMDFRGKTSNEIWLKVEKSLEKFF